jgi:hypothetical protein
LQGPGLSIPGPGLIAFFVCQGVIPSKQDHFLAGTVVSQASA